MNNLRPDNLDDDDLDLIEVIDSCVNSEVAKRIITKGHRTIMLDTSRDELLVTIRDVTLLNDTALYAHAIAGDVVLYLYRPGFLGSKGTIEHLTIEAARSFVHRNIGHCSEAQLMALDAKGLINLARME